MFAKSIRYRNRCGLSLLEVILALAILGVAMVAISQLFNLGYRSAMQATLRSEASILCDSKMAELAAGVIELQTTGETSIPDAPNWAYSVQVGDGQQPGLLVATVTVRQTQNERVPVTMSVVRLIPDPEFEVEDQR